MYMYIIVSHSQMQFTYNSFSFALYSLLYIILGEVKFADTSSFVVPFRCSQVHICHIEKRTRGKKEEDLRQSAVSSFP